MKTFAMGAACALAALGCSNERAADAGADAGAPTDSAPDAPNAADASDAAASDAGDSAAVDAQVDAGCGAYAYCDDFEAYAAGDVANGAALGPWKATVTGGGIVLRVDAAKPHAGKQSLHVTMTATASTRGTLSRSAPAGLVPGNDVFGRAMLYFSNAGGNDAPFGVHWWIFDAQGFSSEADGGVSMNMGGGGTDFLQLNFRPPAPLGEKVLQGGAMTAGAWHCMQWEYDGSGAPPADVGRVWMDGALLVDVPASMGWTFATPWTAFDLGLMHYEVLAKSVDAYLDDFALDGKAIPCPP